MRFRTADSDERPDWLSLFEAPCQYRVAVKDDDINDAYVGSVRGAIGGLKEKGHSPAAIMIDSIFDCPGTIEAPPGYFQKTYKGRARCGRSCHRR